VAGFTALVHSKERLRSREVKAAEALRLITTAIDFQIGRAGFDQLITDGARALAGQLETDLDALGEKIFRHQIADLLYPETRALVRAHQQRGHTVVLCSSATSMQVEPVAAYLGVDEVVCNRFVVDEEGRVTGEVVDPIIWGEGKATAAQRYAAEHGLDLTRAWFYADGDEDVALMHLVGHPRPTNPGPHLTKVAERRGWPISRYGSRGTSAVTNAARFAVGFGALGPITALGTARAAMTGRKWDGLNVLTSTWPKFLLDSHGVSLTILGAANAEAQRPAVFIFNHRNQMDAFMAAAVVKHDFTAVAKKELKTNPLFGTFGRLMDIAFIDRADSAKAVNAMHEVEKLAAQGLSIIVAPEGTRLDTHEVGPFKKGAFVMAMSAGIPIVPIVIRNADDIAGRDSLTVQRGVIDIAVLPPIDVSAWTRAELTERIDEVRAAYLDLLADWPTDDSDPRLTGG
jgi:putative phosphoserine phosphatase/1-acylglycerol-3-phosphate O-acyltransferase